MNPSAFRTPHAAPWPWMLLLCVAGALAYHNSFSGAMVFDDLPNIADDPFVRQFGPWSALLEGYRPLLRVTFAFNYALDGLDVAGYHLFNLAVHLMAGLALFGIVRRTLRLPRFQGEYGTRASRVAFVVALLWLVHPLHTGSVTYIVQRSESMMGMLYLVCIYAVIRGAQSTHAWRWYGAAVLAYFLGLATKEVMITAVPVLLLYDRVCLAASWREVVRQRGLLYAVAFLPGVFWLSITIAPALLPVAWTGRDIPSLFATAGFNVQAVTPFEYARSQPGVILHYLKLTFWPHPLALDYDWPVADRLSGILIPGLIIGGLAAASVWALFRRPAAGFLGVAFFLMLSPTSSIVPLHDLAFEHRMYLPLIPVIALLVLAVYAALRLIFERAAYLRSHRVAIQTGLVAVIALALMFRTAVRNEAFHSPVAIWSQTLEVAPHNHRAHVNLGNAYARQGQPGQALPFYLKAMTLKSDDPLALYNLGYALQTMGRDDEAARVYNNALAHPAPSKMIAKTYNQLGLLALGRGDTTQAALHFHRALRVQPTLAVAHTNLGVVYVRQGRIDLAREHVEQALRYQPDLADAHYQLGVILERQGQPGAAIASYAEALRRQPQHPDAAHRMRRLRSNEQNAQGMAMIETERLPEAIAYFTAAVRIDPDNATAHRNLGNALLAHRQPQEAIRHYRASLDINPDQPGTLSSLAWLLATYPDSAFWNPEEALRLAERACELTGERVPDLLDTRAAAYAAVGRFAEAVQDINQAIRLLDPRNAQAQRAAYQQRLARYRARQSYRQPPD